MEYRWMFGESCHVAEDILIDHEDVCECIGAVLVDEEPVGCIAVLAKVLQGLLEKADKMGRLIRQQLLIMLNCHPFECP